MRIDPDQETVQESLDDPSTSGPPATARPKASGFSNALLALLMVGTSWAIATSVSIWLVTPYLILMAWLLFPSTGRPSGVLDEAKEDDSDPLRPVSTGEAADDSRISREESASAGPLEDGTEPGTPSSPAKARRGRGRAKKVKPALEPTEATWVQVAPGKFVRVEAAESPDPAGPHGSPGVPVEVGATPQLPDRDESDSPESDRTETVESESTQVEEPEEDAGTPGNRDEPSAVDGNAPQAEESVETPDAEQLEARSETLVDDQAEAEPSAEPLNDEGEPSSLSEAFEPIGPPPLADVPPEEDEEKWEEPTGVADPTETTVDETDFDDAGPFDDQPHQPDASAEDADEPELGATPRLSTGSNCWPWRLAPRAGTRLGHPPRTTGRPATPRRPIRSSDPPPPRPSSPRRSDRQRPRRPSRITRAFPPRSPPRRSFCFWWLREEWSVASGRERRDDRR